MSAGCSGGRRNRCIARHTRSFFHSTTHSTTHSTCSSFFHSTTHSTIHSTTHSTIHSTIHRLLHESLASPLNRPLTPLLTPSIPTTLQNPVQRHTQITQHHRHIQPIPAPPKRLRRLLVAVHAPRGNATLQKPPQLVQSPREIRRQRREKRQCRQIEPVARVPREEVDRLPAGLQEAGGSAPEQVVIGV